MYLIIIYLLELFSIILDGKFNILTFYTTTIIFTHHIYSVTKIYVTNQRLPVDNQLVVTPARPPTWQMPL